MTGKWVPIGEAKSLGYTKSLLYRLVLLGKIRSRKTSGTRLFWWHDLVRERQKRGTKPPQYNRLARRRSKLPDPPRLLSYERASRRLQVSPETLRAWTRAGILDIVLHEARKANGHVYQGKFFLVKQVAALVRKRASRMRPGRHSHEGKQFEYQSTVLSRCPSLSRSTLSYYRTKHCPALGRKISWEMVPGAVGGHQIGYLSADVDVLVASRAGINPGHGRRYGPTQVMPGAASRTSAAQTMILADLPEPAYRVRLADIEPSVLRLLQESRADAGDEAYRPAKVAAALTAMSLSKISKLCQPGGPVRYRRSGNRLDVHLGDLADYKLAELES